MSRPTRFEDFRYLGDKRTQVVYDLDTDDADAASAIAELLASEQFAAFGPDTLAEARNRGYRPRPIRPGRPPSSGGTSAGERLDRALEAGLERDVGERGLARERRGVVGEAVEVDPRRAAAVLVVPRDGRPGRRRRCTRSASTHSGSRFFQPRRDAA